MKAREEQPAFNQGGPSSQERQAEADVVAMLRGESVEPADTAAFVRAALTHRVAALLIAGESIKTLPAGAAAALLSAARDQAALTVIRERELRRVLDALAAAGVDALLMKGAHLAYAVYADPCLRPREDTDLLVRPGQRERATEVFHTLGYARSAAISGDAVHGQTVFDRTDIPAGDFDVHWRIAGPRMAADLFDFDALWARSQPVPSLSPHARGPDRADAIAIAAVHLVAHHRDEQLLLWLYDVHLLVGGLDPNDAAALVDRARHARMSAICADVIHKAEVRFPTRAGTALLNGLRQHADEPSAVLLTSSAPAQQVMLDLRALDGWRARLAYVGAHLFPPADYMRLRYAPNSRAPLAWLYVSRILRGARKWI